MEFRPHPSFLLFAALFSASTLGASLQVGVQMSLPSPQPVGTAVALTFSATDTNTNPGTVNWRLEVATPLAPTTYTVVHDFALLQTFIWAQNLTEGSYSLRITARDSNYYNNGNGQLGVGYAQTVVSYTIKARAKTGPVISATSHPLVALFSSPSCPLGTVMRVVFVPTGTSVSPFVTNYRGCNGVTSMNFLIAGLTASTSYTMYSQTQPQAGGPVTSGTPVTYTTGKVPIGFPSVPVQFPIPFSAGASQKERLLLLSYTEDATPLAVNFSGQIVWYYAGPGAWDGNIPASTQIDRLLVGGTILTECGYPGDSTGTGLFGNPTTGQVVAAIDLTGAVVQETNVDRVNEQLLTMGADPISTFNHDIRRLPNGNTLAIAISQRIFPAGTQGNTAPIDIIGTTLVELDKNFQVIWFWDSFQHDGPGEINIARAAPLNEQCVTALEGQDGCPPDLLTSPANDWLHTNTVQYQPADGSLILSMRDQDYVVKIDFNNGAGTGNVIWIMGLGGDFTIVSSDPYPWFSHQHDVEYQNTTNPFTMTVLDNGNTRIAQQGGFSRGYVATVDETALTVTPIALDSLGVYAPAMGSAQILSNGNYQFMAGDIVGTAPNAEKGQAGVIPQYQYGAEITAAGTIVYSEASQSPAYRLWRLTDFYNVPAN